MTRPLALLVAVAAAALVPPTAANADHACVRLVGNPVHCWPDTPFVARDEVCTTFGNPAFLCV